MRRYFLTKPPTNLGASSSLNVRNATSSFVSEFLSQRLLPPQKITTPKLKLILLYLKTLSNYVRKSLYTKAATYWGEALKEHRLTLRSKQWIQALIPLTASFALKDAPSGTGTFYQGNILGLKEQVLLKEGDVVNIGAATLIFHDGAQTDEV